MSDLAATNCGCNDGNSCNTLFLILLLLSCGNNNGTSLFGNNGSCNGACDALLWIILLSSICGGNGNGLSGLFGNGCGC